MHSAQDVAVSLPRRPEYLSDDVLATDLGIGYHQTYNGKQSGSQKTQKHPGKERLLMLESFKSQREERVFPMIDPVHVDKAFMEHEDRHIRW